MAENGQQDPETQRIVEEARAQWDKEAEAKALNMAEERAKWERDQVAKAESRKATVNRLRFEAARMCMGAIAANPTLEPASVAKRALDCADALLVYTGHLAANETSIRMPEIAGEGAMLGDPKGVAAARNQGGIG